MCRSSVCRCGYAGDSSLGAVSMGLKASPFVTHNISQVAQRIDWVMPFGTFGVVSSSSRYRAADKVFNDNPNIKRVVGYSFGGSVALELQNIHPELPTRVYGTPVMELPGRQQHAEGYRNEYDPISIFDRSAKTALFTRGLLSAPALAHHYANNANIFKPAF